MSIKELKYCFDALAVLGELKFRGEHGLSKSELSPDEIATVEALQCGWNYVTTEDCSIFGPSYFITTAGLEFYNSTAK